MPAAEAKAREEVIKELSFPEEKKTSEKDVSMTSEPSTPTQSE